MTMSAALLLSFVLPPSRFGAANALLPMASLLPGFDESTGNKTFDLVLAAQAPTSARMTTLRRQLQPRQRKGQRKGQRVRTEVQGKGTPEEGDGWCYT